MRPKSKWLYVCRCGDLVERKYLTLDLLVDGSPQSIIVFRFKEKTFAYVNRCVHMPRKLNCEKDSIFDDTGNYLRCSMHGIVYDPQTGASQSAMCNGEKLQSLKTVEDNGCIYIDDKRALTIPGS